MQEEGDSNDYDQDLYGDIEDITKQIQIEALQSQLKEKDDLVNTMKSELDQLKAHFMIIYNEKKTLEKNMVAVYNTASRELQRKDREIQELTEKLRKASKN